MSIVGTRPPLISETNLYEPRHKARLAIKPGITGMWQVSGRSDNMLMIGEPGCGKTMIAQRIPTILPEMTESVIAGKNADIRKRQMGIEVICPA